MDEEQNDPYAPPDLRLDYGHRDPLFAKSRVAISWFLLGFALPIIPIAVVGADLYDLNTIIFANSSGYILPRSRDYYALAFFSSLILVALVGVLWFRRSPVHVRFALLGFMVRLGSMGLVEGLCFGLR